MFDYLIHNARILDGSGAPARQGDVALSGGHIAAVGHLTDAEAAQVLDARLSTPGCWWGWGPSGPAWPGSGTDR